MKTSLRIYLFLVATLAIFINSFTSTAQTWCTPTWNNNGSNWQIGVQSVQIGSISNTSGCPTNVASYMNYTSMSTSAVRGASVSYSVVVGSSNSTWFCIYIDFNNDGTFNTSDERVVSSGNINAGGTSAGSFTIPSSSPSGNKRMRVISDYGGMGVAPSACGPNTYAGDCEDYSFYVINPQPLDASIAGFSTPAANAIMDTGNITVKVNLLNKGINTLTSCTINWDFDGVTKTPYSWTGSRVTDSIAYNITLGSLHITPGSHTLRAWSSSPNGGTDGDAANDMFTYTFCTAERSKQASLTIGAGGNFATFDDAINMMSCGILGPVVFTVLPGTYTSRIVINPVKGASATNTVTFRGNSKTSSILTYNATSNVSRSTVVFNGCQYIRFENMTITNTGSSYATCAYFTNNAQYNEINNCILTVNNSYTSSYVVPIESGSSESGSQTVGNNANYNKIRNNTITGGYYGIILYGISQTSMCLGNEISGNTLSQQYYYAIDLYYQRGLMIKNNTIDIGARYNSATAIYTYFNQSSTFDGNIIYPGQYGIYLYYENYYSTGDSTMIINNIITNFKNTTYQNGLYCYYYNYNLRIYNNSIFVNGTYANSYSYAAIYLYYYNLNSVVKNNILVSTGGTMLLTSYYHYGGPIAVDYNDYIYPANGNYYFYDYTTYYTNLATWKNAANYIKTPHDVKSYDQVDPHFLSTTAPIDLHVSANFPKIRGVLLKNVTTDVDNDPRCPFEAGIGADESRFYVPKPVAMFEVDDTICDGTPVVFLNYAAAEEPKGHKWYINGVYQGNMLNLSYTFNGTGVYRIKLETSGCGGVDSFIKTVQVITPPNAPKADFISDKNIVSIYEFMQLLDLSTGCPSTWDWTISPPFGNVGGSLWPTYTYMTPSSQSSQNPILYFELPGTYKVTLKASNANGLDSMNKERYITVKALKSMCIAPDVETSLYGYLTDDFDGPGYGYPISTQTCNLLLTTCGDSLHLNFSEFNVFSNDYLRIYDGSDNTGTPLWNKTLLPKGWGNNMNMTNTLFKQHLVSKTGKMFIEWEKSGHGSAGSYATGGFVAEWTGYALNQKPPVASFQSADTVCLGTPVKFQNTSTGDKMDFIWDYDAQQTNTSTGIDGEFSYDPGIYTPGYIDVVLIAGNCAGSHEFRKSIYLDRPMAAPKPDFQASNMKPLAGIDAVQFTDMTNGCAEQWRWEITPSSFTFTGGTSIASQNPIIRFNDTVWYNIKLIASYNSNSDSVVKLKFIKPITYCTPISVYLNPDIGMSRVNVSNMDNYTSIGDAVFSDYSQTKTVILDAQSQYVMLVERLTNFNAINWSLWIDYNIDGDYNDSGELIFQSPAVYSNQYIDTFVVSKKAVLGTTRMRVGASYNTMTNSPCGPNQYGEYEDYKVYIRPDMTPPVITLTGASIEKIVRCQQYSDSGATAWDNVDGNITSKLVVTSNYTKSSVAGTYTVNYNVVDAQGNAATQVQRTLIVSEDKVAPQLTLMGNAIDTVEVLSSTTYPEPGYLAIDTCSGIDTVMVTGNVIMAKVGEYSILYTATDYAGNKTTVTRKVFVLDQILPSITLVGSPSIDIEVLSNFTDPGVVITDNYCTGLVPIIKGGVDMNTLGTYTITYSVTDCNGNGPASVFRTVKVIDTTNPVFMYTGSDTVTIEVFDDYVAPAYVATDNYWTTLTTTVSGTFFQAFPTGKTNVTGFYTVTYKITDGSGNFTSKTFVVHVADTKEPVIAIQGLKTINLCRFEILNAANSAYTVSDNYDKTLTVVLGGSYVTDYLVNFNYGFYTLTYNCTDASGNKATEEVRSILAKDCQLSVQEGGIEEYVRLYPNPNQGIFTVEVNKGNSASVIVLNGVGQIVKELKLQKTQMGKFDIDLSNQGNGIYMLRIMTDEGTVIKRVTITK